MMWNRKALIITGFSISFVFCLFTLVPILAQEGSQEAWAGIVVGSTVGIWSCLYLFRAIRRSNNNRDNNNINLDNNRASSRWIIISAVGGLFLARLVSNIFDVEIQDFINNAVSAWIIATFSGLTFMIWRRYLPSD